MIVTDILRRVRSTIGDNSSLQVVDATVFDWLNDAQKIAAANNMLLTRSANQNTVVAQAAYTLPADFLKLHSVWYNNQKLSVYTFKEAEDRADLGGAPNGNPDFCYVWDNKLNLFPVPDAIKVLKINYSRQPAEITATGDTPDLPVMYHSRLVDYCLAQVAQMDDNQELYAMKMQEFNGAVTDLKDKPEWEQDQYPYITVSDRDTGGGSEDYW